MTTDNASKIQGLVIGVQSTTLEMVNLENQYKALFAKQQGLQQQLASAKTEAIKAAGLDEKSFEVQITAEGKVSIVPKAATAPATPPTEKK